MKHVCRFGEQITAFRIQLSRCNAEVVMNRCTLEDSLFLAFLLSYLEIFNLEDYREVFNQEYTAKDRNQQFLVDDDGKYSDDSTDGQATCVAHKYLSREGVVPKETNQRTDESADEDNQFFTARDEHDVQIAGIFDVTRDVSQYP